MPLHDMPDLVSVLATADPDFLPIAKSALDGANIPYVVSGEEAVGMLPLGSGGGSGLVRAEILVAADRAEEARQLLAQDAQPAPEDGTE